MVEVVVVLLQGVVVVDTVVVDLAVVAMEIVMQVLQRSDLVLVMQILIDHDVDLVVGRQVVEADTVVEMLVDEVVFIVEVVEEDGLYHNNQVINNICIRLLILR